MNVVIFLSNSLSVNKLWPHPHSSSERTIAHMHVGPTPGLVVIKLRGLVH